MTTQHTQPVRSSADWCYPHAERLDLHETRHGRTISDPYRWLEDPADPRSVTWLTAQEHLYAAQHSTWQAERWRSSLAKLSAVETLTSPTARLDKIFYQRRRPGADHACVMVTHNDEERLLLDPHDLDPTGRTVLETWRPSVEGDLLAYQLSVNGTEDSRLWVIDIATGNIVDGPIDRVRQTKIAWLPGGTHYYYVRRLPGQERYHRRVYLHRVGADPATDTMIFGDGRDKTRFYSAEVSADGRWLTITATTGTDPRTDIWLADLTTSRPHAPALHPIQTGIPARTRLIIAPHTTPHDPMWLMTTSGAPRGRVMTFTPADPRQPWHELIPQRPAAVLTDFGVLTGPGLPHPIGLAAWTRHAISEVTTHSLTDGTQLDALRLPGNGTIDNIGIGVPRDGAHDAWFTYTDYRTPPTLLRYDGRTGRTQPWHPDRATSRRTGTSRNGTDVCERQVSFESHDGTIVRMFIVSPHDGPDRPRPTILTGYGGFGQSMTPSYSFRALAWVRAGGVFAIACLRGGGEEGQQWHHAGRQENKQNVFDDFDAATDYLTEAGWTTNDRLGIIGGSNGGLLIGAAITQHPEKYAAAVCMSPLLDMARYELSGLGPSWRPEYGSVEDPTELQTLLSYSPYHHIDPRTTYPPTLFSIAEGDTRVDPHHAKKMCAALQHTQPKGNPVLLRYERGVGHAARTMTNNLNLKTDYLAFLAHHLGMDRPGDHA